MESFHVIDTDPGGTLQRFERYVERMRLVFDLVFRKQDGSAYTPTEKEKNSLMLFRGGDDMSMLYTHVGKVASGDTFDDAVKKVKDGLLARTNKVVQRNSLLTRHPQGSKSFERWSVEISEAAKLVDFTQYDWKQAAVDAMILQTSNPQLREKALHSNATYDKMMEIGIVREQSSIGAALLAGTSGMSIKEKDVHKLDQTKSCFRCGQQWHSKGRECPAKGQICAKCGKSNHFARQCKSS